MTLAARGSCDVARMAWPMRLNFMKVMTMEANRPARISEMNLMLATVTMPSKNELISNPDSAACTSGPKARFNNCEMTNAKPNVANSDVNKSLPMTRLMMVI